MQKNISNLKNLFFCRLTVFALFFIVVIWFQCYLLIDAGILYDTHTQIIKNFRDKSLFSTFIITFDCI